MNQGRSSTGRPVVGHAEIDQAPGFRQSPGELAHELRNGVAGVRAAVQIVRDRMFNSAERDILTAAIARLDRIDHHLRAQLIEAAEADSHRSGVRRMPLPSDADDAS
jgi:nitrogen-specific signal transduction histidine kinase